MCLPGQYRDPISGKCKIIKDFTVQPLIAPVPLGGDGLGGLAFPTKGAVPLNYGKFKFGGRKCGFGSCAACMR